MRSKSFSVGDKVMVADDRSDRSLRPGMYTITRVMPRATDGYHYRVKSPMDSHERVIAEFQIRPVTS